MAPAPPLLSSDLGSNRHCAAHNFWRELFLPSENLLNTLNRLNKKKFPDDIIPSSRVFIVFTREY